MAVLREEMMVQKVMQEDVVLNIMSAYTPNPGCDENNKEKFWKNFIWFW